MKNRCPWLIYKSHIFARLFATIRVSCLGGITCALCVVHLKNMILPKFCHSVNKSHDWLQYPCTLWSRLLCYILWDSSVQVTVDYCCNTAEVPHCHQKMYTRELGWLVVGGWWLASLVFRFASNHDLTFYGSVGGKASEVGQINSLRTVKPEPRKINSKNELKLVVFKLRLLSTG